MHCTRPEINYLNLCLCQIYFIYQNTGRLFRSESQTDLFSHPRPLAPILCFPSSFLYHLYSISPNPNRCLPSSVLCPYSTVPLSLVFCPLAPIPCLPSSFLLYLYIFPVTCTLSLVHCTLFPVPLPLSPDPCYLSLFHCSLSSRPCLPSSIIRHLYPIL